MSDRPIHHDRIIHKAIEIANKYGRAPGFSSAEVGTVVRRAEFGRFTIEFSGIAKSKTKRIAISLDGETVFRAEFQYGWEDDPDRKLSHWGPDTGEWRREFMALQA